MSPKARNWCQIGQKYIHIWRKRWLKDKWCHSCGAQPPHPELPNFFISRGSFCIFKGQRGPNIHRLSPPPTPTHNYYNQKSVRNPNSTRLEESAAIHLQFVRQYAPHLYRVPSWLLSLCSIEERETKQYASHLYRRTPPICTAALLRKCWGLGLPGSP